MGRPKQLFTTLRSARGHALWGQISKAPGMIPVEDPQGWFRARLRTRLRTKVIPVKFIPTGPALSDKLYEHLCFILRPRFMGPRSL